jgi:oxygen-independent coproporphyrinogen-3 oxidase
MRGHILAEEDLTIRRHILNLMCNFETSWENNKQFFQELPNVLAQIKELERDGLISIESQKLLITNKGKAYVRNVCMPFDLRLKRKKPETQLFSMTV